MERLTEARNKVAAAEPQIEALEHNADSLLANGQAQLQAAAAQAFPQLQSAQDQLSQVLLNIKQ